MFSCHLPVHDAVPSFLPFLLRWCPISTLSDVSRIFLGYFSEFIRFFSRVSTLTRSHRELPAQGSSVRQRVGFRDQEDLAAIMDATHVAHVFAHCVGKLHALPLTASLDKHGELIVGDLTSAEVVGGALAYGDVVAGDVGFPKIERCWAVAILLFLLRGAWESVGVFATGRVHSRCVHG